MATEKEFTLRINGLKQNINNMAELEDAVEELEEQFKKADFGTEEFEELQAELKKANDRVADLDTSVQGLDAEQKLTAVTDVVTGMAGAFEAAEGAAALFGVESEDLEKVLTRVQGAMAIAGGVQAFGQGLVQARNAAQALGVNLKALSPILKGLRTAAGPLAAIATLVAGVTAAVMKASGSVGRLRDEFKDSMKTIQEDMRAAEIQVRATFQQLERTNAGSEKRLQLINQLDEAYPGLIDKQKTLNATDAELVEIQDVLIDQIQQRIKLQGLQSAATEISEKLAKQQVEITRVLQQAGVETEEQFLQLYAGIGENGVSQLEALELGFQQIAGTADEVFGGTNKSLVALGTRFTAARNNANELQQQLDFLIANISEAQQNTESTARTYDSYNSTVQESTQQTSAFATAVRQTSDELVQSAASANVFAQSLREFREFGTIANDSEREVSGLNEELGFTAEQLKAIDEQVEDPLDFSPLIDAGVGFANEINALFNQLDENRQQRLDALTEEANLRLSEIQQDISEADQEISQLTDNLAQATSANRQQVLEELAEEQEQRRQLVAAQDREQQNIRSLENEKEQIAREQFERQKALQSSQAIIDTARAVVNALTVQPLVPLGVALSATAAATGAAQVAKILAQSPGFKAGGFTGSGRDDEPAGVVHRNEYVIPAKMVKEMQYTGELNKLESRRRGYQEGGLTGGATANEIAEAVSKVRIVTDVQEVTSKQRKVQRAEARASA
jgi:DNA repair exonuclease SbcCD ATPase subunit